MNLFRAEDTYKVCKVKNLHIPIPQQNTSDPNQEGDELILDTRQLTLWNVNQVLSFVKSYESYVKPFNPTTWHQLQQSTLNHEYGLNGFIVQHILESDTLPQNPKYFRSIFPEIEKGELANFFIALSIAFLGEMKYLNQVATTTTTITIDEILEISLGDDRKDSLQDILKECIARNYCEGNLFPKFIDRKYFVKDTSVFYRKVTNYYADLKKAIENNSEVPLAQRFVIPSIFNGAGAGKTRACKEIANILRNDLGSNSNTLVATCYLDFSNGSAIKDDGTKEFDYLAAGARTSFILGYRILGGLGLKPSDKYKLCPALGVTNVLNWISNTLKLKENGKTLYLVLCLDEFQEIMKNFPNGWKALCREIEYYMRSINCVNDRICIFAVVSGTVLYEDFKFDVTGISNMRLRLNPISNLGVPEMMKMYFENQRIPFKDGTIEQFYTADMLLNHSMTRLFFVALGRVPKILELSLNELKNSFFNKYTLEDWHITNAQIMLGKMVELIENSEIAQKYNSANIQDEDDGLFNVVYGAVEFVDDRNKCKIPLKTHSCISEMLKKGQIYRTRENTIYCTYFHFKNLLKKFASSSELVRTYNFGKQISTSGESFEVIDVGAIKARIKTLGGGGTASVGELFPGLYCHDLLKDLELQLPQIAADSKSTEVPKEVGFYIHLKEHSVTFNTDYETSNNSPYNIFENKKKPTPFYISKDCQKDFDARWFTFTAKDEKVLVLLQYKLREANVKPVSELFPPSLYKKMKELYEGYRIIYLLITNSRTDFMFTQQCDDEYQQNVGLICSVEKEDTRNPALRYFAPNLYPFYKDLEARTETNIINEFTPLPTNQPNVGVFANISNDNIIQKKRRTKPTTKPTKTQVSCRCRTKGCKQEASSRASNHSCACLKNNKLCSERCQCKGCEGCFNKGDNEENEENEEEEEDEEDENSYRQSKKKLKTK